MTDINTITQTLLESFPELRGFNAAYDWEWCIDSLVEAGFKDDLNAFYDGESEPLGFVFFTSPVGDIALARLVRSPKGRTSADILTFHSLAG
jgi:hypothetical protein